MKRKEHEELENITNLDIGKIRHMMKDKAMGTGEVGYRMGVSPSIVQDFLRTGEAPADLAARLATVLGRTITEISTA